MKEEELIKKLEKMSQLRINWQNPIIQKHQQELKLTLLNSRYFKASKIMLWTKRLAPIGVALVLALVVGFNVVQAKLQIANAMEVAEENEQIQEVMKEKGIEIKDVKIIDNKPYILFASVEEATSSAWGCLTPTSKLYFLKNWGRGFRLFFTLDPVQKAELEMKYADEDVCVIKRLCEKDKEKCQQWAEKLAEKFQKRVDRAMEKAEKAKEKGKDVEALIEKLKERQLRQQEVLSKVLEKAPEQAKEAILKAMERSAWGLENAIQRIQGLQKTEQFREEFRERLQERLQNLNEETQIKIRERLRERLRERIATTSEQSGTVEQEKQIETQQETEQSIQPVEQTQQTEASVQQQEQQGQNRGGNW